MHASLTTLFTFAAAASAATIQPQARQSAAGDFVAEITGWKALSGCGNDSPSNTPADLDFNVGDASLGACIQLPYVVSEVRLGALHQGHYLVSFYTDGNCTDLARGATVSEVGNCLHSSVGPWNALQITTYSY
jgi:hypothetical protein